MPRTVEETLRSLGYGHLYAKPRPKRPEPTYCMFCNDVPDDELELHGGCQCCGNNGAFSREETMPRTYMHIDENDEIQTISKAELMRRRIESGPNPEWKRHPRASAWWRGRPKRRVLGNWNMFETVVVLGFFSVVIYGLVKGLAG